MKKFTIEKTQFDDVILITPRVFADHRGYFCETYNVKNLRELGFNEVMLQDNQSKSHKNVIRGLHYQWNNPMGKLVRVLHGAVRDVSVDVRKYSPTYGQSDSFLLSAENNKQLWVPPGFAHGILSLEDDTLVSYKCSSVYNPNGESGINPFDKYLNIDWGISESEAIISEKDKIAQSFLDYDRNPKFFMTEVA